MILGKQIKEALSWKLATELWRRFPDKFYLIETHSGGGQYECLSFIEKGEGFSTVININRSGVQPGQLSAATGFAETSAALVADNATGEAGQDRGEGDTALEVRDVPVGRGGCDAKLVRGDP